MLLIVVLFFKNIYRFKYYGGLELFKWRSGRLYEDCIDDIKLVMSFRLLKLDFWCVGVRYNIFFIFYIFEMFYN